MPNCTIYAALHSTVQLDITGYATGPSTGQSVVGGFWAWGVRWAYVHQKYLTWNTCQDPKKIWGRLQHIHVARSGPSEYTSSMRIARSWCPKKKGWIRTTFFIYDIHMLWKHCARICMRQQGPKMSIVNGVDGDAVRGFGTVWGCTVSCWHL